MFRKNLARLGPIPPGEDPLDLLLVPRFVRDLIFEIDLQANVPEYFGLMDSLVIISDGLLFRLEGLL